jgi:hypothetical protein
MSAYRALLTDRTPVEFDADWSAGAGGEKTAFFSPDGHRVVLFFHRKLQNREKRIDQLQRILSQFNPTLGTNGAFWEAHFCWPEGIIDGAPDLPEPFVRLHSLATPALGVVVPAIPGNFYFRDRHGNVRLKACKWFTGEKSRKYIPIEEKGNFAGRGCWSFDFCGRSFRCHPWREARRRFLSSKRKSSHGAERCCCMRWQLAR